MLTGIIENWSISDGMVRGQVYGDSKHRFPNGLHIHTSKILELSTETPTEGTIVETLNSVYKLGKPSMEQQIDNSEAIYATIRRQRGDALTSLSEHVRQLRLALALNDQQSIRMLTQRFTFADDGVRLNVLADVLR